MGSKERRTATIKYAAMLLVLSLGLSGCQTCRRIVSKIPIIGRKPDVVEVMPPDDVGMTPPPLIATKVEKPQLPLVEEVGKDDVLPPRPQVEPRLEEALETVRFDYDSAVLRTDAQRILDKNVIWLRENPSVRVQLEGHCDERGTEEYNFHLGERRAGSVKRYLVRAGIDPARLYTVSFGEDRPIDPGHDESAWAKNRRVQFSRY